MRAALIVPVGSTAGAAYAQHLAAAMERLGHQASVIAAEDPVPVLDRMPTDVVPVLDGLFLPRAAAHPALCRAAALVHHPGAADEVAEQAVLAAIPRVVASSDDAAKRLVRGGVAQDRISVVHPGLGNLPRSAGSGTPSCAILSVGALTERKGHDVLLRALARLTDLHWQLHIAGDASRDPAYPAWLRALAEEVGIGDRVQLVPDPADPALAALWQAADVFALATRREGYPTAVAEALRRGLPVATTRAAGSLVTAETGVVVAPDETDQLSKGLRRLIFDEALRRDMAEAAWQAGQCLPSWDDQVPRFVAAITGQAEPT